MAASRRSKGARPALLAGIILRGILVALLLLPLSSFGFAPPPAAHHLAQQQRSHHHVSSSASALGKWGLKAASSTSSSTPPSDEILSDDEGSGFGGIVDRRNALKSMTAAVSLLSGASALGVPMAAWADDGSIGSSPDHPVVVLGAGGKVGKLCCQILAQKGLYTRAVTRSGSSVLAQDSKFVAYAPGDVTKADSLTQALQGASGVIFAASASGASKGGDPAHVDYLGAYNTAKACIEAKVPKLVLISAGTVTRPESAGFKATNFFVKYVYGDKIMDYKMAGEAAVRDLYQDAPSGVSYAVIRPGGLNEKPSVGSSKVHVSQGDVYSSEVTREDVALVSVATLLKGKATDFVTFELNQVEGLGKAQNNLPDLPSELVHAGAPTFDALVDGLLTDAQIKDKYPDVVNSNFRGSGIEPVSKLA